MEQYNKTKVKRYFNRIKSATLGTVKMGVGTVGLASSFPPAMAAGLGLIVSGANNMQKAISGEYIKNSMVNVTDKNRIVQNTTSPNILLSAMLLDKKQKASMLMMQEMNFLLQADRYKVLKDGTKEPIRYNTRSHSLTGSMLKRLQNQGYIENLEQEKIGARRLVMEKMMLGNIDKKLFKKQDFYNISFNIADREITEEDILKMYEMSKVDIKSLDDKNLNVRKDKQGKVQSVNLNLFSVIKDKFIGLKDKIKERFSKKEEEEPPMLLESVEVKDDKKDNIKEQLGDMVNSDFMSPEEYTRTHDKSRENIYEER